MKKLILLIFFISFVSAKDMEKAYNAPARIDVKGPWTMYLSASYLFIKAKENGLDAAFLTTNGIKEPVKMDFNYKSAFKVAALANFDYDKWGILFQYTRIYLDDTKKARGLLEPIKMIIPSYMAANSLSNKWDLDYDMIDINLRRTCYVGEKLKFTPFLGLRGGWIDQKDKSSFDLTANVTNFSAESELKSDAWLLGPQTGLEMDWHFGKGFKFFSNSAVSILYEYFKTYFKQDTENETYQGIIDKNIKDKFGYAIANFDFLTGFSWGTYFDNDNWHINFSLGYEFIYFWNQNEMRSLIDSLRLQNKTKADDLMFHGLNVTARLDF